MRRLKPGVKVALISMGVLLFVVILSFLIYKIGIGRVSNSDDIVEFTVKQGSTYMSIANDLKDSELIRSDFFYKIYIKMHKPKSLQAGKYSLSENMSVKEIVNVLSGGSTYNPNAVSITFKEGINMRKVASLIAENTSNTEDDVWSVLKDGAYLDSLIDKYWFITDEIKNSSIYYSLEGYLFPNTYQVTKDMDVKEIFNMMIETMADKLEPYKSSLENGNYSIHEILTLSSIVELEAANSDDRSGVAGVFFNRLESNWSLGSDVTTYYGARVDMSERDLYQSEINAYNAYNTRNSKMAGKLPVGPICLPSMESIVATINPESHSYYYFVTDKNKKTYFSKTNAEHERTVANLKEQDLWYEY